VTAPATYDDLRALPETMLGQILDGELVASPHPAIPHLRAASMLVADLGGPFSRGRGGPGDWWILFAPEAHLGRDVLVPDVAGWRKEHLPALKRDPYFTVAPHWLCEIVSPETAAIDRVRKLRIYAREHVPHVWLVDPDARTLEVYRLQESHYLLSDSFEGDEKVRAEPFDVIELQLGDLWLPATPT
jgi:Uma2 family endonuclease